LVAGAGCDGSPKGSAIAELADGDSVAEVVGVLWDDMPPEALLRSGFGSFDDGLALSGVALSGVNVAGATFSGDALPRCASAIAIQPKTTMIPNAPIRSSIVFIKPTQSEGVSYQSSAPSYENQNLFAVCEHRGLRTTKRKLDATTVHNRVGSYQKTAAKGRAVLAK
jgi:hypothetical protein